MGKRKRVNLSIRPLTYVRLEKLRRLHRFKTICEMMTVMAEILAGGIEHGATSSPSEEPNKDFIDTLFRELEDAQSPKYGNPYIRQHKKNMD